MSNSEFIEELMFKAHALGFFHEMHPKVNTLIAENPELQHVDAYYKAYQELKAEQQQEITS